MTLDVCTPQLMIDLDVLDANLKRMRDTFQHRELDIRIHFKSLRCAGLASYLQRQGMGKFLCAKLNEAEVLAEAGIQDIFIANQIVEDRKMNRICEVAKKAKLRICVDQEKNIEQLSQAAVENGVTLEVLVEVDIGMERCGVEPGEPALKLAQLIHEKPGLEFVGLQGYDGHLQLNADPEMKKQGVQKSLDQLLGTRDLIQKAGIPVKVVTGAGTGTSELVGRNEGVTEIQPGSFLLMDVAYNAIRPEFACSLSILCTVISRREKWYVLDAGSKAISQDFGKPQVKGRPQDQLDRLSEEHARVISTDPSIQVGDRVEVLPAHCCATMNLHRQVLAIRKGQIEATWPIEASGRYD